MAQINSTDLITNPSARTLAERRKFASLVDKFATFKWGDIDMFSNFGAFIINEKKGSLKMYNGPSFTNNYTKQQFQDGYTNISGVTFNTQQISFTMGVYWISIEDYRVLMNVLHPYELNILSFNFEETYGYKCKLSNIKDSTRYIVGQEVTTTVESSSSNLNYSNLSSGNASTGSTARYYTEIQLTFDVVGKQCAVEVEPYILYTVTPASTESDNNIYYIGNNESAPSWNWPSDLDFPFILQLNNWYGHHVEEPEDEYTPDIICQAVIKNLDNVEETYVQTLFELELQNIQYYIDDAESNNPANITYFNIRYDSEHGLLYWKNGSKEQVLSLLSVSEEGKRLVKTLITNRFYWPGRLDYPEADNDRYAFYLKIIDAHNSIAMPTGDNVKPIQYIARRRTNVI